MRLKLLPSLLAVLVSGCVSTGSTPLQQAQQPSHCPTFLRDTHEQLQGTLWMQTAAESDEKVLRRKIGRVKGFYN